MSSAGAWRSSAATSPAQRVEHPLRHRRVQPLLCHIEVGTRQDRGGFVPESGTDDVDYVGVNGRVGANPAFDFCGLLAQRGLDDMRERQDDRARQGIFRRLPVGGRNDQHIEWEKQQAGETQRAGNLDFGKPWPQRCDQRVGVPARGQRVDGFDDLLQLLVV